MTRTEWLAGLSIICLLSGCASFRVAGQVQAGRQALLANDPEAALSHFQQAAQSEPNYRMASGPFREGVWTYVGRAQYNAGKLPEARQSLERALSFDKDDYLARLYLGLTLARSGDRSRGLKEIEGGMKGIYDWLEYINYNTVYGQFWDPGREIRSEIEKNLAMISGKEFDWQRLISSGEWLGRKMEEEIDLARQDERRHREREFDRRSGIFFGLGF
jgi:tetratricopeptide (TPR) repeat protein